MNDLPPIASVTFDSAAVPPGDAFDIWKAAIPFYRISLGQNVTRETFRCHVRSWFLGDLILSRTRVSPVAFVRTAEQVRADAVDSYSFFVFTEGSWSGDVDGRPLSVGAGQVVGFDLSRPFVAESTDSNGLALSVARTALGDGLRTAPDLHGHVFAGASAELLLDHLLSLERHLPGMTQADIGPVVSATLAMLGAALTMVPHPPALRANALAIQHRVRRFIENNLHDPGLTPDHIAAALSLSRSTLSRSFEPLGGLAAYVVRRRLEAVRTLLVHPDETRGISELARTFGFVSPSHFAAAFKRAYGRTPGQMREQANGRRVPGETHDGSDMPTSFRAWMRHLQVR